MPQNIIDELAARGLLADVTARDELGALMAKEPVPAYAGYDPTGTSLHVGNLVPMIMQARLQRAGHPPIIVVGGATGMIGDPSGKSSERNLLDDDQLAANVAGIRAQLGRFLDFDAGPAGAIMTNNADWFKDVSFLGFLRDAGKHLTINYMMAKDSVRARLEGDSGISYTEFSYMLLQAWDFVQLSRRHGCRLQVGGSDQWGNITAGIELSRKLGGPQLYGLVAPLLLDASGQKMGKTSTGERVWLDAERTSPYAFYQYWLNQSDVIAPGLLKMFSFRPLAELDEQVAAHLREPHLRIAQRALAADFTTWVHGAEAVRRVEAASKVLFGGSVEALTDADLAPLLPTVPSLDVPRAELEAGVSLIDLLVRTGLAKSKGAARDLVKQGGAYVNNERVTQHDLAVTLAHLATETMILLRSGQKSYRLVRAI